MTAMELLEYLRRCGVEFDVRENNRLHYKAPAGVITPEVRGELIARKPEILSLLRAPQPSHDRSLSLPVSPIVPKPADRYQPFQLTEIQQAYLIGREPYIELGNVSAHIYLEIEGANISLSRLNRAWNKLIDRHDMLRAVFSPDGHQRVLKETPTFQIESLDLRGRNPDEVASDLDSVRRRMSHQVLSAGEWPLFDIRASRYDGNRLRLHVSIDLLVADGSSLTGVLLPELYQLYADPDAHLPRLHLTYRDYVLAEAAFRRTESYQKALKYWRDRLETLPRAPELPLAKSPSSVEKPRFVRRSGRLRQSQWRSLQERADQLGVTPSVTLMAMFCEVLAQWSRGSHFVLNLTFSNRLPLHEQVHNVVGDFTSVVLLEVNVAPMADFAFLVRSMQDQLFRDLNHSYVSGVVVLRELAQRLGAGPAALMPVVFTSALGLRGSAANAASGPQGSSSALTGNIVYGISQTPQVWIDHQVLEQDGCLVFQWDVVDELFPSGLIDEMFEAYTRLLVRRADDHGSWRHSWSETSRSLLMSHHVQQPQEVNGTEDSAADFTLWDLFARQVEQRGDEPAVISSTMTLTYNELYQRAVRIAYWLRAHGAERNALVAVIADKGWEQIAGVLGVLCSGAAYLPIDANVTSERLSWLLHHGEVTLALTQSQHEESISWPSGVRRFHLDLTAEDDTASFPPTSRRQPDDLAYVTYTSGSTGQPKGVMICHRSVVNTILDVNSRFGVTSNDRVFAISSLSFDLSVYDLFGPLAAGGAIVLPNADALQDSMHWAEMIEQHRVTVWNSVPAVMELLVNSLVERGKKLSASLRLALLSGDWIPVNLPHRIWELNESVQVISLGGATEASIWSICYPIDQIDPSWVSIPYGKPLRNQSVSVLNDAFELCPIWVTGQLYIGGAGVAEGYWRDEEKTAASFFAHPQSGRRIYRTGDLGRYLPDGNIEFLGREDSQVKIRGYRIELGEIEATLARHPQVQQAIVTVVGHDSTAKRLAAYVAPKKASDDAAKRAFEHAFDGYDVQLTDLLERAKFKLRQPGLRRDTGKPSIPLPPPMDNEDVRNLHLRRRSFRVFRQELLPFKQFSEFLACLRQLSINGRPKYRYPSAGGLYPVQVYLSIKPDRVENVDSGTYYYHPQDHRLVMVSPEAVTDKELFPLLNHPVFESAAFSIFLIGQLQAIEPLYGSAGRDFCFLEAGYIGQALMEQTPTTEVGLCALGRLHFDRVEHLFDLNEGHLLLHTIIAGWVDPASPITSEAYEQEAMLVGAVDRKTSQERLVADLKSFLKAKLPEYMLPSSYVILSELPRSRNGKIDRRALPPPDKAVDQPAPYVAPRSELERTIATILQEVLEIDRVGIHDNFFDLGGTSFNLIQAHSRISEALKIDVPVVEVFVHPTISALADYLSRGQTREDLVAKGYKRAEKRRIAMNRSNREKNAEGTQHE